MYPDPDKELGRRLKAQTRERIVSSGVPIRRKRKAFCVVTDAIYVPEWATRLAIPGLSISNSHIWLRRGDAALLAQYDRDAGGVPRVTEAEVRICKRCRMASIAEDAECRRELDQMPGGEALPCGVYCVKRPRL